MAVVEFNVISFSKLVQKLEWKGTPRLEKKEDMEVLLIGDSIIQKINCEQFKNRTWLFSYPGLNVEQIRHQLENEVGLPPPSKVAGTVKIISRRYF